MLVRTMKHNDRGTDAAMFLVVAPEVLFWLKYQGHPRVNSFDLDIKVLEVRESTARIGIKAPRYFRLQPGERFKAENLDFEHHSRDAWDMVPAQSRSVEVQRSGINQLVEDELSFEDEEKFRELGIDRWTMEEAIEFSRTAERYVVLAYYWVADLGEQKIRLAWRSSLSGRHIKVQMPQISNVVTLR